MKFGFLIAVKDVVKSRTFYEELFNLTVIEDYGEMVGFNCGLILQQDFDLFIGIPKVEMKTKENNCELYFEEKDFDSLVQKIKTRQDVTLLHDVLECPWGQRVIHFYDLDDHLIEVGESLKYVVKRFLSQNMTIEEIAIKMDCKVSDIQKMLQQKIYT